MQNTVECVCVCDFCFNLSSVVVATVKMHSINCVRWLLRLLGCLATNFTWFCQNEFLHLTKYRYLLNEWMGSRDITNERIAANKTRKERWKGRIVKCIIATISLLSYSIMDCVSEIFRCFCFFFLSLTIQFLFFPYCSVFNLSTFFLSDRTFNAFSVEDRKREQVRESSFIFLMIF